MHSKERKKSQGNFCIDFFLHLIKANQIFFVSKMNILFDIWFPCTEDNFYLKIDLHNFKVSVGLNLFALHILTFVLREKERTCGCTPTIKIKLSYARFVKMS